MSERPLRILHLTAGSDAGGLSRYIFDLCSAMQARGHDVAVAGQRGAWHWLFEKAAFPWIDVPLKGGPVALLAAARKLRGWLAEHPVDVIHTHYRRPTLVARRLQRAGGAAAPPVPILYSVHLSDLRLSFPWRLFSDFGDQTHVASVEARRWVIEQGRVRPERVTLIPHGIDMNQFPPADEETRRTARRELGLPQGARVAAFVGRLDDPKNEDWLLDVATRLSDLHVLLAGEGPHEAELRRRIERDGLAGRVHLLGHRDPLPVYRAADALLLPSLREGFSLVCAEAMSVGVPVLRTRTAGTQELIIEDVTGRSTPIEHDAFVSAAAEFLSLPTETLRRMGAAGSERVRNHFTFDRQLEQTLALYRRIATL
jgi:glycosyltransferase involved in cell wall biosynthesis